MLRAHRPGHPAQTVGLNGEFADVAPDDPIGKMAYAGRRTTLLFAKNGRAHRILVGAQTLGSFETSASQCAAAVVQSGWCSSRKSPTRASPRGRGPARAQRFSGVLVAVNFPLGGKGKPRARISA